MISSRLSHILPGTSGDLKSRQPPGPCTTLPASKELVLQAKKIRGGRSARFLSSPPTSGEGGFGCEISMKEHWHHLIPGMSSHTMADLQALKGKAPLSGHRGDPGQLLHLPLPLHFSLPVRSMTPRLSAQGGGRGLGVKDGSLKRCKRAVEIAHLKSTLFCHVCDPGLSLGLHCTEGSF